jgi:hypothetical protein
MELHDWHFHSLALSTESDILKRTVKFVFLVSVSAGTPVLLKHSDICVESCRFGMFPLLSVKSSSA